MKKSTFMFTLFVCILIVFSALTLHEIKHKALYYDEITTLSVAQGSWQDLITYTLKYDYHFPTHYIIAKVLVSLVPHVYVLRVFSYALGVLSLFLFYDILQRFVLKDANVYLILSIVFLFSINTSLIFASSFGRSYSLMLFFYTLTLWSLFQLSQSATRQKFIVSLIATGMLILSHYYGFLYAFSLLAMLFFYKKELLHQLLRNKKVRSFLIIAFTIISVAVLFKFVYLIERPDGISWIEPFTIGFLNFNLKRLFGGSILYYAILALIGGTTSYHFLSKSWPAQNHHYRMVSMLIGLVIIPVILASIISFFISILQDRYLIPLIVPFYLLVGTSLSHISSKLLVRVLLILMLVALSLWTHIYGLETFFYDDWHCVRDDLVGQTISMQTIDLFSFYPHNMEVVVDFHLNPYLNNTNKTVYAGFNNEKEAQDLFLTHHQNGTFIYLDTGYGLERIRNNITSLLHENYTILDTNTCGRIVTYYVR